MKWTPHKTDAILNGRLRAGPRPKPWAVIAQAMGCENAEALDDVYWKAITGYGPPVDPEGDPKGPRKFKPYAATEAREYHTGEDWNEEQEDALLAVMAPDCHGQARVPACTIGHAAAILARSVGETQAKWDTMKPPEGFGLL